MVDNDKPTVHASLKDLDNEAKTEPFTYMTKASKRVVFPDPGEMDWEKSEEFTRDLNGAMGTKAFLTKYLGEDGFKAIEAEKFTGYQMTKFGELVSEHYKAFLGGSEKDDASRS